MAKMKVLPLWYAPRGKRHAAHTATVAPYKVEESGQKFRAKSSRTFIYKITDIVRLYASRCGATMPRAIGVNFGACPRRGIDPNANGVVKKILATFNHRCGSKRDNAVMQNDMQPSNPCDQGRVPKFSRPIRSILTSTRFNFFTSSGSS